MYVVSARSIDDLVAKAYRINKMGVIVKLCIP